MVAFLLDLEIAIKYPKKQCILLFFSLLSFGCRDLQTKIFSLFYMSDMLFFFFFLSGGVGQYLIAFLTAIFLHTQLSVSVVIPSSNCYALDNSSRLVDFVSFILVYVQNSCT